MWFSQIRAEKRRYGQAKARIQQLPTAHRTAAEALERYLNYHGSIAVGDVLAAMLEDLADLFEQAAASGTSVRAVVGDDPVAFAEEFLDNYAEGQWINKERARLVDAIDRATASEAPHPDEPRTPDTAPTPDSPDGPRP